MESPAHPLGPPLQEEGAELGAVRQEMGPDRALLPALTPGLGAREGDVRLARRRARRSRDPPAGPEGGAHPQVVREEAGDVGGPSRVDLALEIQDQILFQVERANGGAAAGRHAAA